LTQPDAGLFLKTAIPALVISGFAPPVQNWKTVIIPGQQKFMLDLKGFDSGAEGGLSNL
jgi:hypothetical protein